MTVKDSKFINNTASLNGGAIDIDGINDNVINCQFDKNHALNGGAIKVSGDKTTIEKSTFTENNAVNGGAINWVEMTAISLIQISSKTLLLI